jgi:acyl dehydratase
VTTGEKLSSSRYFADIRVGDEITAVTFGPMSTAHLMRWSAAIENWHRVHYDFRFATEHDGLPDNVVNGSLKQHLVIQGLRRWLGPTGWLARLSIRFVGMDIVGDALTVGGEVLAGREIDGLGYIHTSVRVRNSRGVESTRGFAVAAVPLSPSSASVPYPFPGLPADVADEWGR